MPARSLAPARATTGCADFRSFARNLQHSHSNIELTTARKFLFELYSRQGVEDITLGTGSVRLFSYSMSVRA
jgi:hypothetical protein